VLAGAELDLGLLKSIGLAGALYVVGRLVGKFSGVSFGGARSGLDRGMRDRLRYAVFAQAGLAVGLTTVVAKHLPEIAPAVTAIALSAVIIFEIIGPLAVRWVLIRSGEAQPEGEPVGGLLD